MKNIRFEGKVHQFPDDATDAEISAALDGKPPAPTGITTEDRRAYTEALPGTPEGMKAREGIEGRYGGREAFLKEYDPAGEVLGKVGIPALAIMGATAGTGAVPAIAEGGAAALASPALRRVAVEALKWLAKGAAAGVGAGGAYEAGRRAMGK